MRALLIAAFAFAASGALAQETPLPTAEPVPLATAMAEPVIPLPNAPSPTLDPSPVATPALSCEGAGLHACWIWCSRHPNRNTARSGRYSADADGCEVVDRDATAHNLAKAKSVDLSAAVAAYAAAHAADKGVWGETPSGAGSNPTPTPSP